MAVPMNPNDDDEDIRALMQSTPSGDGAMQQLSGGVGGTPGGTAGGDGAAAGMASGGAPRPGGSRFVSMDRYLAANRPAVDNLSGKITSSITGAGNTARSAISTGLNQFNTLAGQGEVTFDQNLANRFSTDAQGLAANQAQASQFGRMRDASYTGPLSLENTAGYQDIARSISDVREVDDLAKNESGLTQLADRSVTGNRTTGGRAFDTQLLLGDEGLRGRIDTARQSLQGIDTQLGAASTSAQQRAQQGAATSAATRDQTRNTITAAQNALQKAIDDRVAAGRQQAQLRTNEAQAALAQRQAIPTAGAAGRYYDQNNPLAGSYQDRAAAPGAGQDDPAFTAALQQYWSTPEGKAALATALQTQSGKDMFAAGMARQNVPEFIHGGSGQAALPQFNQYINSANSQGPSSRVLADLGVTPEQWAQFTNLAPVGAAATAASMGTNNVNPFSFVEDYQSRLGDLSRYLTIQNPEAAITRENAATADQYRNAAAMKSLGGDLGRTLLDQSQIGRADSLDTATDLVSFDLPNAMAQRNAALGAINTRAGGHVAGNARSGSDSFIKQYGQAFTEPSTYWLGPLAPLVAAAKAS